MVIRMGRPLFQLLLVVDDGRSDNNNLRPDDPQPPVPVFPTPSNLINELLKPNNLAVVGGGSVLLLGLVLLLLRRRARNHDEDELVFDDDTDDVFDDSVEQGSRAGSVVAAKFAEPVGDRAELDPASFDNESSAAAAPEDALGEADIYMAYGRLTQAVELLEEAIAGEPDRSDLRLKLLDVYARQSDAGGFKVQMDEVQRLADPATITQAEELRKKFPEGTFGVEQSVAPPDEDETPGLSDDFDGDLGFELDSELDPGIGAGS